MSPVLTQYRPLIGFSRCDERQRDFPARQRHVWASHEQLGWKARLFIQICGQFWSGGLVTELLTTRCTAATSWRRLPTCFRRFLTARNAEHGRSVTVVVAPSSSTAVAMDGGACGGVGTTSLTAVGPTSNSRAIRRFKPSGTAQINLLCPLDSLKKIYIPRRRFCWSAAQGQPLSVCRRAFRCNSYLNSAQVGSDRLGGQRLDAPPMRRGNSDPPADYWVEQHRDRLVGVFIPVGMIFQRYASHGYFGQCPGGFF